MSGRYHDYNKGSSRSARDDSRTHRAPRSRSRSPRARPSGAYSHDRSRGRDGDERPTSSRDRRYDADYRRDKHHSDSEEDVPAPPPPPRITKISIGFTKPKAPIKMNFGGSKGAPKPTVASVFSADDDDEPEEMPAEAKMRMRNIGRETPTSAGPNSFGKTKQGFCDAKKVFEKNLKEALEAENKPAASLPKFPQTIYRIKGP